MALLEEKVRHIGKAPNISQINSSSHYVTYSEVSGVNNPNNSILFADRYGTATPDVYLNGVRLNASVYTASDGENILFDSQIVLTEGDIIEIISYEFDTIPRNRNTLNLYFYSDYLTSNYSNSDNKITLPNLPINANDHVKLFLNGVLKDGIETVILTTEKRIVFDLGRAVTSQDVIHISIHRSDDSDLVSDPNQASIYYFNNALSAWNAIYYDENEPTYLSGFINTSDLNSTIATRDSWITDLYNNKAYKSVVDDTVASYKTHSWVNTNIPLLVNDSQNVSSTFHQPIDGLLLSTPRINNLILGNDFWLTQGGAWFGDTVTGEPDPSGASEYINVSIPNSNIISGYGQYPLQANDWVINNLLLMDTSNGVFANSPRNIYYDSSNNKILKDPTHADTLSSWNWFLPHQDRYELGTYFRITKILPVWWAYTGPFEGLNAILVNGNVVSIPATFRDDNITETVQIGQDFATGGIVESMGFGGGSSINNRLPAWNGSYDENPPTQDVPGGYVGGGDYTTARTASPYFVAEGDLNGVTTGVLWGQEFTDLVLMGKLSVGQVFSLEGDSVYSSGQVIKGVISGIDSSDTRFQPGLEFLRGIFWQSYTNIGGYTVSSESLWSVNWFRLEDAQWSQPVIYYTPLVESQNVRDLNNYVTSDGTVIPIQIGQFHDFDDNYNQTHTHSVYNEFDYLERPKFDDYDGWVANGSPSLTDQNGNPTSAWDTYMRWDYPEEYFSYNYPYSHWTYDQSYANGWSYWNNFVNHFYAFHDRTNSGASSLTLKLYEGEYDGTKWGKNVSGTEAYGQSVDGIPYWFTFQEVEGSQREIATSKYSFFNSEPWTEHPFEAYGGTQPNPSQWNGFSVSNPASILPQFWVPDYLYPSGSFSGYFPNTIDSAVVHPLDSSYYSNYDIYKNWMTDYSYHSSGSSLNDGVTKSGTYSITASNANTISGYDRANFSATYQEDGRPFNINVREAYFATFQDGFKFPNENDGAGYFLFPFAEIDVEIEDDTGKVLTWYSGKEFVNKNGLNILQTKDIWYHDDSGFVKAYQPHASNSNLNPFFTKYGPAGGPYTTVNYAGQSVTCAGVYNYSYQNDTFTFQPEYRDILYGIGEDNSYNDPDALHATLNNDWIFSPTVTIRGVSYTNKSQITNDPNYDSQGGYTTGSRRYKIQLLRERLGWVGSVDRPTTGNTPSYANLVYGYGEHTYPSVFFVEDTGFLTDTNGYESLIIQTTNDVLSRDSYSSGYRRVWFMDKNLDVVTTTLSEEEQKEIAYVKANKFADRVEVDWRLVAFDAESIDINPTHISEHQTYINGANEYPSEQQDLEDFSEQNPVSNYDPTSPNTAYKIIDEMSFELFGPVGSRDKVVGLHFDGYVNTFYGYDAPYTHSTSTTEGNPIPVVKTFNIIQNGATFGGTQCDWIPLSDEPTAYTTITSHISGATPPMQTHTVPTTDQFMWDRTGFSTQVGVPYTEYIKDYGSHGTKLGGTGYLAFSAITIPSDATSFRLKLANMGYRGSSYWGEYGNPNPTVGYRLSIEPVGGSHTFLRDNNGVEVDFVAGGSSNGMSMPEAEWALQGFNTVYNFWAPLYAYLDPNTKLRLGEWDGVDSSLELDPAIWQNYVGQDVVIKVWDFWGLSNPSHSYWSVPIDTVNGVHGSYGTDGEWRWDPTGNQWWNVLWLRIQYQFEGPTIGNGTYESPYPPSHSTIHLQGETGGYSRYNVLGASLYGTTNRGLFVEHQEGVRYDGSFTGNVNNSVVTHTEPRVLITSQGTHQNGSGLTDGQSFTFQTEGFEQTDSIIEMVNSDYTLYETPQTGSERPTSSMYENRDTYWKRACALEFTKLAGYDNVYSVGVDTSASYPSVAVDHWNSSAIKFIDDWASNTGGTVTLFSKADGYRRPDHYKAWYGNSSPNYYGSALYDDDIESAVSPWDQRIEHDSRLLDTYGYGPDQNTGFSNQWLYDLCITKEPLPAEMRPSSEVIIRIDDYQERTQIVDGLKTIMKEIHDRMANHQDQKYIFEYDLPNDYPGGVPFSYSKYGSYGTSEAQSAMKSIYEKGLDTDATTTYGRIINDKGEEIEFRNYGPWAYNNFFAREGDYIVTRYMKIKTNGHIYLTFETNTTRYGSIISQGRVTFNL